MKKQWKYFLAVGAALVCASCANSPSGLSKTKSGSLEVWASLEKPQSQNVLAKSQAVTATTWDSLIVQISSTDMDTMHLGFKFNPSDPYVTAAVDNIPAGKKRLIEVFTKTKDNLVIHVSTAQCVDISASEKKVLDFKLLPTKGSIYIDLSNIPTNVKRICGSFASLTSCEDRSTKLYMSIDNIADKTGDSLVIEGTDSAGTVVYRSSIWLVFSVTRDTSVATKFYRVTTGVSLNLSTQIPASTVISGNVGAQKAIAFETGRLIVSEIMYNANDSEYIEVYNPSETAYNDSLIVELDGSVKYRMLAAIPPKSFYVIGRINLPWVDAFPSSSSSLDLSSTGNWLCLRAKSAGDTVMDWVAFAGGSNSQEWPNLGSAKKSIVLDSLVADATYNNYGRNWLAASTLISAAYPSVVTTQCGTPKTKGL
jgi:hypothetical protein